MLQESESNRTNTGPQAPGEQKMDTHQLLRKERTPLKTKFSSTVDAIVSDDETTGLVTSADDDLDSAGDREREGGGGDLDELPLLAFADAEELGPASEPRLQKSLAEVGPGSEEQGSAAAAPAPGTGTDHGDMLTDWGGTLFSIVTGGDGKMGMPDSEERKGGDNAGGPEATRGRPPQAAEYFDSDNVDDFFVEVFKTTDDNDSGMDTELDSEENGRDVEDPEADRAPGESPPEATQHGGTGAHSSPLSRRPSSLPLAGEGKDTHRPALENTDSGLQEAAVHTAEDPLREGGPGARMAAGGSENSSVWKAAGRRATEETKGVQEQESSGAVPPGDEPHNTTGDHVQVPDLLPLPVQHRHGEHKEELGLETPDQPQFSPPEGGSSAGKPEEEVPALGEGLSQFHQRGAALGEPAAETESDLALHRAEQGAEEREPPDGTAAPGSPAEETEDEEEEQKEEEEEGELEDDEELPEELLEDENAVGAKRSQEIRTEIRDRRPLVMPGGSEEAHLGTIHPDPGAQENQQEPSVILVIEKQNATEGREGAGPVRGLGSAVVGEEDEDPWDPESAPKGEEKAPSPRPGEALQKEDLVGVGPGGDSSGPLEKPVGEAGDMGSPGPASAEPGDDLSQQSPHAVLGEDGPIIRSFFKEQQALQRFLKYLDAHELEAMLQDMAAKLKVAQQESLPYNVGKVLDKAFRASEAQILSAAERMLDARMTGSRELGVKERSVLEEYAVLDDVQDLIYFVRYKHLAEEELALLTTAPTLDEGWRGPTQETQSPPGDPFLRENTADASVKLLEEPGPWGQQETGAAGASAETQRLNPEEDEAPGMIVTEGSGADPGGVESQREELAHTSPLESAVLMLHSFLPYLSKMLVATLPEDVQPGPDFYGLPWKPVLLTAFLGIVSFAIFFWRTVLAVKERIYQVTEQQISEKVKNTTKENTELIQKLSNYEQKVKESKKLVQDTKKENMILSEEAIKYKDKIKVLEENSEILGATAKNLRVMLESEREQNVKNQDLILGNRKSIQKLKDVISMNASELSEVQIALNEAKLSEEKVKSECQQVQEENARLKKKKEQLAREIEDWKMSHAKLSEQIKAFENSQRELEAALAHKDDSVGALTNCITQLNRLECTPESEGPGPGGTEADELANGEVGGDQSEIKNQIKQMMDVSRTQTTISVLKEDLKLLQAKLRTSMSTKCDLEEQIKKLDKDCGTLQSARTGLEEECRTLQQKVEILNELYQQKEMALQKKLSQEEYELQERDQRMSAADEKVVLAAEEVKVCRRRIQEMEEELQKTERSLKNQLATHEKKAHENWLKARNAERQITEERRESANLRHRLLEMTQKMAMRQDEPVIVKPMPGRPGAQNPPQRGPLSQNGSFGPSPVSVSGGDCSPPLSVEPPSRPISATSRRDLPRSEFDAGPGPGPTVSSGSRGSSPGKGLDEAKAAAHEPGVRREPEHAAAVTMAVKGPPAFPGPPFMGGPLPPPVGYGPPPPLCGPYGPRPMPPPPPPFVPCVYPPLGLREFAPGVPPGRRDLPGHPWEFLPGHAPFRPAGPLGPREYFLPGPGLPPLPSGPQDYVPPPAKGDPRDEPAPASPRSSQDSSQALRQSQ
ncbi:transport and Golgi organization protein 1 homolog [Fukomys damarensis]|uniref:transport and Golgi organization protein 1 homolog n=1 Tax=Fukomys damarensis TaxID=885580 RepID=UPI00053FF752|nr:transport and Golgi organization protein 1 homolog [Fukomys damarensis]